MKSYLSILATGILLFGGTFTALANARVVTDPVADYISRHSSDARLAAERNEHVLKFEVDVDNDGKLDVFLSSEKSALMNGSDGEYENDVRSWDLYRNLGGGNYAVIDQEQSTAGSDTYLHPSAFLFDAQKVYIGSISEMGAYGMLALYYLPKHNEAQISAYILESDYFESKNFPNPTSLESGVYHRDDSGNIHDLPTEYQHYFATPPTQTVTVISQTF